MAEERRLGQDLHVQERRGRLRRDPPRASPADAAGTARRRPRPARRTGAAIAAPRSIAPALRSRPTRRRPIDVIAGVDRREQRVEVRGGPRLHGRGHQHERQRRPLEPAVSGPAPSRRGLDDDDLRLPASLGQERRQPGRRLPRAGTRRPPRWRRSARRLGQRIAARGPRTGRSDVRRSAVRSCLGASHDATARRNAAWSRLAIGPGRPSPIAWPSIVTTGRTSIVVPVRITSSARYQLAGEMHGSWIGNPSPAAILGQPLTGRPGQDLRAFRGRLEPPVSHPEQRGMRRLGHHARRPTRIASYAPVPMRRLVGQDVREQVRALHVAPLPAQVRAA